MVSVTIKRIKFGVIVFYVLLFAGLALYDERPEPDMAAEMARPLPSYSGPDNAYACFLGFDAPAGENPCRLGQEVLRKMKNAVAQRVDLVSYISPFLNNEKALDLQGERPGLYGQKHKGIDDYISTQPLGAKQLLRENKELLARYGTLLRYRAYREPLDYGFYMPFARFSPLRSSQILFLLDAATRGEYGVSGEPFVSLQKDAEFWRMAARSSTTLLSKLFSFGPLRTDILFAAELGTRKHLSTREMAAVQKVLRPFDGGETGMAAAFAGEARYMYKGAEQSRDRMAEPLDRLLYKKNATDNRMYENILEMVRMAESPPHEFAKEAVARERAVSVDGRMGIPFLYNPAGEILALIGRSQGFHRYIERGHDLEGLRRLALLKIRAHRENVRPGKMQEFLDTMPVELRNPYTNESMHWDAEKESLYFNTVTEDRRVEIYL